MTRIPAWGTITAAPHEHLIHLRDGRVVRAAQGGSCFRWPRDTVALVDTSVRRLQFTADQVTREKVGVAVTGLAVFRVVAPLVAWRMLDLTRPEALADILREMFVGSTRRLVANLTLDDCMTRRKDALAAELLAEIAPVVQGAGRVADDADRGWGVALDTIEIQDVRVLSQEVFERLQAPYREELALSALQARAEVEREQATLAHARARATEDRRRELMALEEARVEAERARARANTAHNAELKRTEHEADMARTEERAKLRVRTAELEAAAERVAGETRAELTRLQRDAESQVSDARLQEVLLTETLPRVAEAFSGSFEHATVISGGEMDFLTQGITQVLAAFRAMGGTLPGARA